MAHVGIEPAALVLRAPRSDGLSQPAVPSAQITECFCVPGTVLSVGDVLLGDLAFKAVTSASGKVGWRRVGGRVSDGRPCAQHRGAPGRPAGTRSLGRKEDRAELGEGAAGSLAEGQRAEAMGESRVFGEILCP